MAVDDLNFAVSQGEVLGFLGPNGAGKTTTIRMLAGIIAPTSGYAVVAGERTDKNIETLHEQIGLLTETPGFYERLSARRNLEFFAGFYPRIKVGEQVEKYLKAMGLWERREDKVNTFSKGMKQRLAIARALLNEPSVLFLDEPTSGLDPEAASWVRNLIKDLSAAGRTIFLSTHNLTEAESLCQRIAVVKTKLLAHDTPENLRVRLFQRRAVVRLEEVSPNLIVTLKKLPFVKDFEIKDNNLLIELVQAEEDIPALVSAIVAAGGKITRVNEEEHSLEDIYLSLVREDKAL
jgi:ABC-2 type transport system ATP-binding protein